MTHEELVQAFEAHTGLRLRGVEQIELSGIDVGFRAAIEGHDASVKAIWRSKVGFHVLAYRGNADAEGWGSTLGAAWDEAKSEALAFASDAKEVAEVFE